MEYQITSHPNWHTVVRFTIAADRIKQELLSRFEYFQKNAQIEGFRKGKVPPSLLQKMFGKSIEEEVIDKLIDEATNKLLEEHHFDILTVPEIKDLHYDDVSGLSFELHFDVRPTFDIAGFKGMPVEREIYEVSDDDVDFILEELRDRHAMVFTVEGEAKPNHYLIVDMQEIDFTGVPIVGEKMKNQVIWLKEEDNELTPQLLNVKAGEERRIKIHTPNEKFDLHGNKTEEEKYYLVKVREVKERRLPDLDDEFAQEVSPFQTLQELRQDLQRRIEERAERESWLRFFEALEDELIKRTPLELPPSLIDRYLDEFIKKLRKKVKGKIDEEEVRSYSRPMAIRNLKWMLIRERLLEQFNLEVTDEELQQALDAMAVYGEEGRQRAEKISKDAKLRDRFHYDLEDEKIHQFLAKAAKVTEVKKKWQDIARNTSKIDEEED